MASIKLANGTAVKEIRVWDGSRWVGKSGRVRSGTTWAEFIRPILTFQDNNAIQSGMSKQSNSTLAKAPLSIGSSAIPVQSSAGFYVGQEVTIADGVNSESVRVLGVSGTMITTTALAKSYKNNATLARTNSLVVGSKLTYPTRTTYTIT